MYENAAQNPPARLNRAAFSYIQTVSGNQKLRINTLESVKAVSAALNKKGVQKTTLKIGHRVSRSENLKSSGFGFLVRIDFCPKANLLPLHIYLQNFSPFWQIKLRFAVG